MLLDFQTNTKLWANKNLNVNSDSSPQHLCALGALAQRAPHFSVLDGLGSFVGFVKPFPKLS